MTKERTLIPLMDLSHDMEMEVSQQSIFDIEQVELLENLNGLDKFIQEKFLEPIMNHPDLNNISNRKEPAGLTFNIVFWARSMGGKSLASSEFLYFITQYPEFQAWVKEKNICLNIENIPFANCIDLAKVLHPDIIDPSQRDGTYSSEQYNFISKKVMADQVVSENDKKYDLTIRVVQPSAPTIDPDRGYSAIQRLAKTTDNKSNTLIIAIIRDNFSIADSLQYRESLLSANPYELVKIFKNAKLSFKINNRQSIGSMDIDKVVKLIKVLKKGMAPPNGVKRSDTDLDKDIEELYKRKAIQKMNEEEYWKYLLFENLKLSKESVWIGSNPYSSGVMTLHFDLLEQYNCVREKIKKAKLAQKQK